MSRFGARLRGTTPVAQWFGAAGAAALDSIQTGTISVASGTGSNTATISSVDTARTVLFHLGTSYNISGTILTGPMVRIALTNSTTVTATDVVTADGATATVSFVVVQFKTGSLKSVQRGTVTTAAGTATIASVNTAKSFVNLLGYSTTSNNNQAMPRLALTNATTVTITAGGGSGATASFEVWEFF